MNITIILQARMGSSRLSGKVLKKIGTKTLLDHIFYRLSYMKHPARIILATSVNPKDDIIEKYCIEKKIEFFRGSEDNVLERYYLCAKKFGGEHIVRLTADNPFTDIEELDNLIDIHVSSHSDYSHSFGVLPVGVGAEIFTFNALEESYNKGTEENHKEHVNEYIQEHPEYYKIAILTVPQVKKRPDLRLTVDTEDDYRKACFIVENSHNEFIDTKEAIQLCSRWP